MFLPLGAKDPGHFNNPLALLSDCHRRIEHFLDVLIHVAGHAHEGPLNQEHRLALEAALRYFRSAAVLHMQDEEQSLFPRMRNACPDEVDAVLSALEELEADHVSAQVAHHRVEELCRQWMLEGHLSKPLADDLVAILNRLAEVYRRHISLEDSQVFPLAGRVLQITDLQSVGLEMALRRRVKTAGVSAEAVPGVRHGDAESSAPGRENFTGGL